MNIPEHYKRAVVPHIIVKDAAAAIQFYASAFGASELFRLNSDDGTIAHAEISVQGSALMLSDPRPPYSPPGPGGVSVILHVWVPHVDDLTAQAVAAEAQLLEPAAAPLTWVLPGLRPRRKPAAFTHRARARYAVLGSSSTGGAVMAWPGNEMAAVPVGCGHLRASHADRERVIGTLKAAFVQGRLTRDEFDGRIGQALASRTYAELAAVIAGIPVRRAAAPPPRTPPRRQASNAVRWGTSGLLTPVVLAAAIALTSLAGDGRYEAVGFVIAFVYFMFWLSAGADMLWQWHCASLPTAKMCVRCAHTAASHRARASCAVRLGSVTLWRRCPCAGYVPPGLSPQAADLDRLAATG